MTPVSCICGDLSQSEKTSAGFIQLTVKSPVAWTFTLGLGSQLLRVRVAFVAKENRLTCLLFVDCIQKVHM